MHSPATRAGLNHVLIFSAAYILAAALFAFVQKNGEFIFYIVVMMVLIGALAVVHRRVGLSRGLLWSLSIWGLLHMAGGLVPVPAVWTDADAPEVLYNFWFIRDWLKYDQLVHAYGFGITTWLCWQALSVRTLNEAGRPLEPTAGLMVLCAAAGMGFGAFNEVIEFIATLTLPETNVGGYENTGWDLVFNFLGASLAALILSRTERPQRNGAKSGKTP